MSRSVWETCFEQSKSGRRGADVPALDVPVKDAGIVGGLPIGEFRTLYCVTEMNTREEIDQLVRALEVMT